MYYLGGKNRIAKHVLEFTQTGLGTEFKNYIEPFVGGCNMIKRVNQREGVKIMGFDKNPFLVALFNYAQYAVNGKTDIKYPLQTVEKDMFTKPIEKDLYEVLRKISKLPPFERAQYGFSDELIGFAGFIYSYRGDFFQGYSGNTGDSMMALQSFLKTVTQIGTHVDVGYSSFENLVLPKEPSVIYCDPPYKNERYVGKCWKSHELEIMDYEKLYDTLRNWRRMGHVVYLSERTAPSDFTPIWCKDVNISMRLGADWRNVNYGGCVREDAVKNETLYVLW